MVPDLLLLALHIYSFRCLQGAHLAVWRPGHWYAPQGRLDCVLPNYGVVLFLGPVGSLKVCLQFLRLRLTMILLPIAVESVDQEGMLTWSKGAGSYSTSRAMSDLTVL
jgi:hypothetical protein